MKTMRHFVSALVTGSRHRRRIIPLLLAIAGAGAVEATTVYRSEDANGVVTFSDTPPENNAAKVIELQTPPASDPASTRNTVAEIEATTEAMAAARREREKHRAELREMRRSEEPVQYVNDYPQAYTPVTYYPYRHYNNIIRPPHHGRPDLHPRPVSPAVPLRHGPYPASAVRRHYDQKTRSAFVR